MNSVRHLIWAMEVWAILLVIFSFPFIKDDIWIRLLSLLWTPIVRLILTKIRKRIYYYPHFIDKSTEVWEVKLSAKTHTCKQQSGALILGLGHKHAVLYSIPESIDEILCAKCHAKRWEGKASELEDLQGRGDGLNVTGRCEGTAPAMILIFL